MSTCNSDVSKSAVSTAANEDAVSFRYHPCMPLGLFLYLSMVAYSHAGLDFPPIVNLISCRLHCINGRVSQE